MQDRRKVEIGLDCSTVVLLPNFYLKNRMKMKRRNKPGYTCDVEKLHYTHEENRYKTVRARRGGPLSLARGGQREPRH
jgi:hypothetical protein